jgi:site-specific DNA-methyltransferase (adenine-specific)
MQTTHKLLKMFSFSGDTVVDPFCGSGTILLAALNSERHSIGIEVEEKYCEMIVARMTRLDLLSSSAFSYYPIGQSSSVQREAIPINTLSIDEAYSYQNT